MKNKLAILYRLMVLLFIVTMVVSITPMGNGWFRQLLYFALFSTAGLLGTKRERKTWADQSTGGKIFVTLGVMIAVAIPILADRFGYMVDEETLDSIVILVLATHLIYFGYKIYKKLQGRKVESETGKER